MNLRNKSRAWKVWALFGKLAAAEKGAELVEFAFTLPFLFVMLVGIIDFGGAWALKDKIAGAARDGARVAVASFNDTTNPQCGGTSCAVQAAASAVVAALNSANVNTCAMDATGMTPTGAAFTWSNTATCPNGGTFTITVARAVPDVDASTGTNVTVLYTQVNLSYPYTFNFTNLTNGLLQTFSTANAFSTTVTISGVATMANLN